MERKPYSAGAVKFSFWFMEFRKTVQLLSEGKSFADIKKLNEETNIYGAPTKLRAQQIYSTVTARIKTLDESFYPIFLSSDLATQKLFVLTAALLHDTLFFDFVYEVVREKMILGSDELTDADIRIFFKNKQEQSEKVASLQDYTLRRLGSCYKTQLYEAGLLESNQANSTRKILKPILDIAYWISQTLLKVFSFSKAKELGRQCLGMRTGDNERFLRLWTEVSNEKAKMNCTSKKEAIDSGFKWFPYNKGGEFRKWYGNLWYVVNWENDGFEIKELVRKVYPQLGDNLGWKISNEDKYFCKGLAWSRISTSYFGVRLCDNNLIFDTNAPMMFANDESMLNYYAGILTSKVATAILQIINPTITFQVGDIGEVPIIVKKELCPQVDALVEEAKKLSRFEWDSYEISWDFKKHPLLRNVSTISEAFNQWQVECDDRFNKLKANEEELNRIFIDIYGLQEELTPEVEDKDVTVRKADLQRDIKSLLSYAVGCMFGRYSTYKDGLLFAGEPYSLQAFVDKMNERPGTISDEELERAYRNEGVVVDEMFFPDADNVIPITDEEYLDDDIVSRLCAWLKAVYGADTLEANLDYIAKALGNKGSTSREIIRNYFLNDFFKDHCQTYSVTGSGKRPIYWLFDSGKQNGFKALVYLHRYTPDTIGNLRIDYLHKMQRVYESEINRMQDMMDHSNNAREVAAAGKRKDKLAKQLKECREYDEKISHLALSRIELDLDDGVKVNYRKLQTAQDGKFYEVLADSKNIMVKEKK